VDGVERQHSSSHNLSRINPIREAQPRVYFASNRNRALFTCSQKPRLPPAADTIGGHEAGVWFFVTFPRNVGGCSLNIHRVAKMPGLWETVGMTNQPANQQERPQHREDYKVHKLVQRIETKLALQTKAVREADRALRGSRPGPG
jgi:hypothetical protein